MSEPKLSEFLESLRAANLGAGPVAKQLAVKMAKDLEAKLEAMGRVEMAASEVKSDWLGRISVAQLERGWPAMKRLIDALAQQEGR